MRKYYILLACVICVILIVYRWQRSVKPLPPSHSITQKPPTGNQKIILPTTAAATQNDHHDHSYSVSEITSIRENALRDIEQIDSHRLRVTSLIQVIRDEPADQRIIQLNADDAYTFPGVLSASKNAQNDFPIILGNRRVLRIIQDFDQLPPNQAAAQSKVIFHKFHEISQKTFDTVLNSYINPAAPKNSQSMLGNKWALSTSMFLTARYGKVADVLNQIDEIDAMSKTYLSHLEKGTFPETLLPAVRNFGFPDNRFYLNSLAYAVQRDPSIPASKKEKFLKELSNLVSTQLPVVAWNAMNTWHDAQYRHLDSPDISKGVEEFTLYDWPTETDQSWHQAKLQTIKQILQDK